MIEKECIKCAQKYTVTKDDLKFYEKISPTFNKEKFAIPEPIECPDCRQQKRLAFRNEFKLYHRKCDLCEQHFVSIYSKDKEFKVYCPGCYFSDKWDPMEYGRDFNFDRPFFNQFKELYDEVPKPGLIVLGDNENSDYSHDAYRLKNCYLTFDGEQGKDCFYGETFSILKDCLDFLTCSNSELLYECLNCSDSYNLKYSRFCTNCSDSYFLSDCVGCKNCFGCVNLHRKEYYIFNEPYTKEEYFKKIKFLELHKYENLQKTKKFFDEFVEKQIKKSYRGQMNENVSGDNINNSKNAHFCFDSANLRDCKYCTNVQLSANDCYDVDIWGDKMSRVYNSAGIGAGVEQVIGSYYCGFDSNNICYSIFSWKGCSNIFGCVNLIHKSNCIFNKQYSEKEYQKLSAKIAKHMQRTGEWGLFFPIVMSSFGYNETVAQQYYPLNNIEAREKKFKWQDKDLREYKPQTYSVPDDINDLTDEIKEELLACEDCARNFRIIEQELLYYKKHQIPIPHKCFFCRHQDRYALRNPRKLWARKCDKCQAEIKTSYSPDRPETIYCEPCYLKEVV
ncbi:hypothetical protein ACFLZH_01645 [Patescibacteria group bacterium]